jgi:hypothetical protein
MRIERAELAVYNARALDLLVKCEIVLDEKMKTAGNVFTVRNMSPRPGRWPT